MPTVARFAIMAAMSLAALVAAGCQEIQPSKSAEEALSAGTKERTRARKLQAACSSPSTYDRLKHVAFEDAMRIRNANRANLDTLATYSTVRMENPVVKSRNEALDVTVCSGRFVLDLPPGAERGFAGERRIQADIEYAAQMAADGSGLVYQIRGAEPIIYKLAAFNLKPQDYLPPAAGPGAQLARGDAATPAIPAKPQRTAPETPPDVLRERTETAPPAAARRPKPAPTAPAPAKAESRRAGFSSNPSFSCRSAHTRSERMVCANDRLAALDREMSSLFFAVMSDADRETRSQLRRSRDRFLAWRERCANEACIARAYQDRMAEISDIAGD